MEQLIKCQKRLTELEHQNNVLSDAVKTMCDTKKIPKWIELRHDNDLLEFELILMKQELEDKENKLHTAIMTLISIAQENNDEALLRSIRKILLD